MQKNLIIFFIVYNGSWVQRHVVSLFKTRQGFILYKIISFEKFYTLKREKYDIIKIFFYSI